MGRTSALWRDVHARAAIDGMAAAHTDLGDVRMRDLVATGQHMQHVLDDHVVMDDTPQDGGGFVRCSNAKGNSRFCFSLRCECFEIEVREIEATREAARTSWLDNIPQRWPARVVLW